VVKRLDTELKRLKRDIKRYKQDVESPDTRDEYYEATDNSAEWLRDFLNRDVVGSVSFEVVNELDELIKQLEGAEPKAGGPLLELGRTDTIQTSSCGQDLDEELQEIRANRRAEMDSLVRQIEDVYETAREADWET
jgi:DNA-binding PadR family transcriptional regulator